MWHLGTWFSGGLSSVRFTAALSDVKDLFQAKFLYDSMILLVLYLQLKLKATTLQLFWTFSMIMLIDLLGADTQLMADQRYS